MKPSKSSFGIFCLGCPQNEYDAKKISRELIKLGLKNTLIQDAKNIIVLSCSVRQSAVDRIWGKLNLWTKDSKRIFILGCVLPIDQKRFRQKYPELRIYQTEVFIRQIPKLFKTSPKIPPFTKCTSLGKDFENKRRYVKYPENHGYVPIQTGCDNFCAYCAVPYTRGREKSRPSCQIIQEIKSLIKQKKNYITLLGQNVNSYGLSKKEKMQNIKAVQNLIKDKNLLFEEQKKIIENTTPKFAELLWEIEKIKDLKKLDFLSPNPQDMTQDVINWMAQTKIFSKKINLPLQSGSDKILKKMNRRYSAAQYLKLARKIKKAVPDIDLTTDIIVGFPGETQADFEKTFKLCQKIGFRQIYIGKYSARPATVAQKFFKDNVSWEEKKRRWERLNELVKNQFPTR
ncbi:MAG: tRNA-i(6)A37 methylthiotransferase [Candidatus Berkelbacteria bacterium Licking1014_7]|uniref:tRNA-i(6)A37 methylthiotransferase n=1 Tax=Candidatus Berkelbacteria bacterium Licking1014_7 TaxID=2017147 RepID=A0A554LKN7_9BACT|nr:MAG: tRNA-i(6)A37 methylthiotransferase [Candidatus Berkelbacteria bacterium Licking1014_7]